MLLSTTATALLPVWPGRILLQWYQHFLQIWYAISFPFRRSPSDWTDILQIKIKTPAKITATIPPGAAWTSMPLPVCKPCMETTNSNARCPEMVRDEQLLPVPYAYVLEWWRSEVPLACYRKGIILSWTFSSLHLTHTNTTSSSPTAGSANKPTVENPAINTAAIMSWASTSSVSSTSAKINRKTKTMVTVRTMGRAMLGVRLSRSLVGF